MDERTCKARSGNRTRETEERERERERERDEAGRGLIMVTPFFPHMTCHESATAHNQNLRSTIILGKNLDPFPRRIGKAISHQVPDPF